MPLWSYSLLLEDWAGEIISLTRRNQFKPVLPGNQGRDDQMMDNHNNPHGKRAPCLERALSRKAVFAWQVDELPFLSLSMGWMASGNFSFSGAKNKRVAWQIYKGSDDFSWNLDGNSMASVREPQMAFDLNLCFLGCSRSSETLGPHLSCLFGWFFYRQFLQLRSIRSRKNPRCLPQAQLSLFIEYLSLKLLSPFQGENCYRAK